MARDLVSRSDVKRTIALASLLLAACGGRDRTDPADPNDPNPAIATGATALAPAHVAPERVFTEGQSAASLAVDGVIGATVLSGGSTVITTGTLRQSGQRFTYERAPTDRLVIVLADGRRFELFVDDLRGNLQAGAEGFFGGDHAITFRITEGDRADLRVTSTKLGQNQEASAQGRIQIGEIGATVDLRYAGRTYFENDSTGAEYDDQYRVTGTVVTDTYSLNVDESWHFVLVSSTGARGATASSATRTIASRATIGGAEYVWQNVVMKKAFRNGTPNEIDTFWAAEGEIFENGRPYGRYRMDIESVDLRTYGVIKFYLDLPSGTQEVESWTVK